MRTRHPAIPARLAVAVAMIVVVSACSGDTSDTTTTTTVAAATTTTAAPTTTSEATTTTVAPDPVTVEGAPEALVDAVLSLFGDRSGVDPAFSDHLAGATAAAPEGTVYTASVAELSDGSVAVVTDGTDVVIAATDAEGTWSVVGGHLPSLGVTPWYGAEPIQLYIIGSDARPGEAVARMRADSHHIVTIAPDGSTASIVGLPRDTLVTTPEGTRGKLTNVMASHGPERVVATAEILTGLEFQGYVLTGFAGFVDLVDEFGGFEVDVPVAMNDRDSKAYLDAGLQWLGGDDMLAFTRNRKGLAGGDFTRQFHHGVVMQWGLAATIGRGVTEVPDLLAILDRHTLTDLTPTERIRVGGAIGHLDPFATPNIVVPARHGSLGGAYVAELTAGAFDAFAALEGGPLPADDEE